MYYSTKSRSPITCLGSGLLSVYSNYSPASGVRVLRTCELAINQITQQGTSHRNNHFSRSCYFIYTKQSLSMQGEVKQNLEDTTRAFSNCQLPVSQLKHRCWKAEWNFWMPFGNPARVWSLFYGSPLSSHSAECPSALWNSAYRMKLGSCWILITIVKYKSLQYKCIPLVLHPLSLRLTIFCEILVKLSITWDLIIVWSNSCEMSYSLSLKINKNANYCKSSHIRDQGCEHLGLYAWIANCIVLWIKNKSNGPLMI